MKSFIKTLIASLVLALSFVSCNNSDDPIIEVPNDTAGLSMIKSFSNDTHTIELYSKSGKLSQGYHDISLKIKNKTTGLYENNANVSWLPTMHMTSMSHSSPHSSLKVANSQGSVYNGYIVFTMAQNSSEYWDLKVDYSIKGTSYSATSVLDVPASSKRNLNVFTGTDGNKYIVAYVEPKEPKIGINDLSIGVWKKQDMYAFPEVNGFTVKIDPRMPSMGNHSSPNNVDAKQPSASGLYLGKLSLTMSGFWKINLQVADASGAVLKGEPVTDANPSSSIFFELEF